MSGLWMRAANRSRLYLGARGDGVVSNANTRTVLRELASMSNGAGVVYATFDRLMSRTGLTRRTVERAMARLRHDGWVVELRRGVGNRHGIRPRPGVFMLARLPDERGVVLPAQGDLWVEWERFVRGRLWGAASKREREWWRVAQGARFWVDDGTPWPVDNGPFADPYNPPVNPLQPASAGGLVNERDNYPTEGATTVRGGRPAHWRTGRSTAALYAIPGSAPPTVDDEQTEPGGPTVAPTDRLASESGGSA